MGSVLQPLPLLKSHYAEITFNIPLLPDYRRIEHPAVRTILWVESVIAPISIISFTWFIYSLVAFASIHRNLKIILIFHIVHFWAGNLARIYFLLAQLAVVDIDSSLLLFLCSFSRFQHYSFEACASLGLALERLFATLLVTKYEQENNTWVSIVCILYMIAHAQILAINAFLSTISMLFFVLFVALTTIAAMLIFLILHRKNQKNLRKLNRILKNTQSDPNVVYSLSRKFQLEENIRVLAIYRDVGIAINLINISLLLFSNIVFVLIGQNDSLKKPISALLSLISTSIGLMLPIGGAMCFQGSSVFCRRQKSEQQEGYMVEYHTSNTYFAQLQQTWETP